jgi:sulfite reductase (ferredoxin)
MDTTTPSTPPEEAPAEKSAPKRSGAEDVKENSRQLRGTILDELLTGADHFGEANKNLLKFHGTYQQEDRDARKARKKDGVGKHHMFMVRCKIPGGHLTAAQYLAVDEIACKYANGTLRFTSRQGIQLHGVLKSNLKDTIAQINHCLLTTLGACGDVERNVMACPMPHHHDGVHAQLQETAKLLAAHLAPRTRAYHEIWLDGAPLPTVEAESVAEAPPPPSPQPRPVEEPLYGKVYLPRKFKTGLALPEDNCIDVYAQDLGLLAIVEDGHIAGYNLLVGGGMGMTHGNANTFPYLAKPICYVPARAVVGAAEAVIKLFCDHGNRADRKRARIKYLVHDWGVEKFRAVLSDYVGAPLLEPRPVTVRAYDLHLGWQEQGDGNWCYGLSVENGRVKDEGAFRLRTALRTLVERLEPDLRLTPMQDILLCDLDPSVKDELDATLAEHGVTQSEQLSNVQRYSMACPAVPTCGLAISESERVLPSIIDQLEAELTRLGLQDEKLSVRMTGCPNGCARPYQSDIGLVGRSGDKYTIFVGGHVLGHRLNFPLRDLVPQAQIVPMLVPVLEHFKKERQGQESFGDFCQRLGVESLQVLLPESTGKPAAHGESRLPKDTAAAPQAVNGGHRPAAPVHGNGEAVTAAPAAVPPEARLIPLGLSQPEIQAAPLPTAAPRKERETLLTGLTGEERRDASFRYNSDGSVRETVVYYYGADARAAQAQPGDPLRREAVYLGLVDPLRLYADRKLSDTHYVGPVGHERRDVCVEYHPDGSVARALVFYYEGEARAAEAPSGAAVRRQVAYDGLVR